jgi:hypothetical protein
MTTILDGDLASIPKRTTGYLCPSCDHLWDGFTTPCTVDEMRAHHAAHGKACPKCGAGGTYVTTPEERERRLQDRGNARAGAESLCVDTTNGRP